MLHQKTKRWIKVSLYKVQYKGANEDYKRNNRDFYRKTAVISFLPDVFGLVAMSVDLP